MLLTRKGPNGKGSVSSGARWRQANHAPTQVAAQAAASSTRGSPAAPTQAPIAAVSLKSPRPIPSRPVVFLTKVFSR